MEFLDLKFAIRRVNDFEETIAPIHRFGFDHSDVIAAIDSSATSAFIGELHSAEVSVSALSELNDGLDCRAESGISTKRLHGYAPTDAKSLTIKRILGRGDEQVQHTQNLILATATQ